MNENMTTNNWTKLRALVWKNWIVEFSKILPWLIDHFISLFILVAIIAMRIYIKTTAYGNVIYKEALPIDNLSLLKDSLPKVESPNPVKFHLAYSPNTSPVLESIVKEAATSLELTYSGYADSRDLENALIDDNYLAGVEFDDSMAYKTTLPQQLNYKLRFPSELRTAASVTTWMTNQQFKPLEPNGPRNQDDKDGGIPSGYLREGFLPVQNAISTAFITQAATNKETLPKVFLQRYPYPSYIKDDLLVVGNYFGITVCIIFLDPMIFKIKNITMEKDIQVKEVIKIMGVQNWLQWMAWFVNFLTVLGVLTILITIILMAKWDGVGVMNRSSATLVFFFILVYAITLVTVCFLLSTFFSKSIIAAIAMQFSFYAMICPYLLFLSNFENIGLFTKLLGCLVPHTAMCLGMRAIFERESQGDGFSWSDLFSHTSVDDTISIGLIIIMMLLSCVVYMTLCLYVEQISPGELGMPQKWNFPFKKSFWTGNSEYISPKAAQISDQIKRDNPDAFEEEPKDAKIGLQVQNLTKIFGDKTAVNNVSLNMYENETTVLLGHNGAGKTTMVSMLTGMIAPTSGTAIINGYDIKTNLNGARMSIGVCPQHNILFDVMTVRQHLVFYSRLKGLEGDELEAEVDKYMRDIHLESKAKVASKNLSGGMKRKLSVCAAFCGGTKVVLLDEPSSGMDPAARRQLWDLIILEKYGRTILLTTHFMDEADALGDRIAIMSIGELKCIGTPFFLKKKYGSGYHLICVKKDDCDSTAVTELLRKHIPGIEPATDIGSELSYRLPDTYSSRFKILFEDMESNSNRLKLEGYGISMASLEDVFMKVGAEMPAVGKAGPRHRIHSHTLRSGSESSTTSVSLSLSSSSGRIEGTDLLLNQWRSMLMKKYLYTIRNKLLFAIQNLLPLLFVAVMWFLATKNPFIDLEPLPLDLLKFPTTVTVLETSANVKDGSLEAKISNSYKKMVNSLGSNHELAETGNQNFIDYALEVGKTYQARINSKYIAAATVDEGKITAWLNNRPLHSAPITLNLIHNAMAITVIGSAASIHVTNYPIPFSRNTILSLADNRRSVGYEITNGLGMFMIFIIPMYTIFLIKERQSRARLVQFVSGLGAPIFWLSHFLWDYLMLLLTLMILLIAMACIQVDGYETFDELGRVMVVFIIFGCSILPFTYIVSETAVNPTSGYTNGIHLGVIIFFCYILIPTGNFFRDLLMVIPLFAMLEALSNLYTDEQIRKSCKHVWETMTEAELCKISPECCNITPFFAWNTPGILYPLTCLLFSSILYFYCLIFNVSLNKTRALLKRKAPTMPNDEYRDEDVKQEKERVKNMSPSEIDKENLVLDKLTKFYGEFLAVNQISLVVKHSECFGLLGVNGAGKTTTFKMLTGDVKVSSGEAFVKGWSLRSDLRQVYTNIGYCPQFDALFDDFTGREVLKIYCLIRGIPDDKINDLSTSLANDFGFMRHYNKPTRTYSGGNKRKLSTAITMIGSPSLIYLDEPTSGMDPGSRRLLWNMICQIRDSGKSIVLTSHNMDECEALCTRLAIMVNGEFKCIGSIQHLKNRFTKGVTLRIKMKRYEIQPIRRPSTKRISAIRLYVQKKAKQPSIMTMTVMEEDVEVATDFIVEEFPGAYLKERFLEMLTFYIPLHGISWSKIFGMIEDNKEDLNIEDYSVCQTSLEDIFLQFAQHQREETS